MKRTSIFFIILALCVLVVSCFALSNYFSTMNETYEMKKIKVNIEKTDNWDGRNPCFYLYAENSNSEFCVSSLWYNKFEVDSFCENFYQGKEYTIYLSVKDIEDYENGQCVDIYGISSEDESYLTVEDSIAGVKSNSIWGLVVGLLGFAAVIFLIAVVVKEIVLNNI